MHERARGNVTRGAHTHTHTLTTNPPQNGRQRSPREGHGEAALPVDGRLDAAQLVEIKWRVKGWRAWRTRLESSAARSWASWSDCVVACTTLGRDMLCPI